MAHYEDIDKQNALQLTIKGVPVTKICERIGCTRATYYNWKNQGVLTGGKNWEKYIEELELRAEAKKDAQEAEKAKTWSKHTADRLRGIAEQMMNRMSANPSDKANDLTQVINAIQSLEMRGAELLQLQREFARRVIMAIRDYVEEADHLEQHDFKMIVGKMEQIQDKQIKEADPENAELILQESR